jgi:hypothetical protein
MPPIPNFEKRGKSVLRKIGEFITKPDDLTNQDLFVVLMAWVLLVVLGVYLLTWIDQRPLDIPTPSPVYWTPDHIGVDNAVRARRPSLAQ